MENGKEQMLVIAAQFPFLLSRKRYSVTLNALFLSLTNGLVKLSIWCNIYKAEDHIRHHIIGPVSIHLTSVIAS